MTDAAVSILAPDMPGRTPLIIGVVGAGTMGAGIAQVCIQAGHEVLLYDIDEAAIGRGRARIRDGLARLTAKGTIGVERAAAMEAGVRDAHALAALAEEADLVIEAALEQLELKSTIFQALDAGTQPDVLLATNTSALSVTTIADAAPRHPERVLGLHFFNPAPLMPLVEVASGERTSAAAIARGVAFVEGLGKTAVVCRDAPGFIVNRVNRPFTLEALRMLEDGSGSVEAIDRAIRSAGYPMGPFELMDLVGVDVNLAVARSLYAAFDEAERFRPSAIQEDLVNGERFGRKSGEGFYRYDGGQRGAVAVELERVVAVEPLSDEEIVRRVELPIINEAYHAVGEQVAQPPDIDRAMKLGANHPHGPFERAGQLG
ncbi:MAG: 3-hydroxybutyryl-CoA dehydrogenase, partial [Chloroflexi bacterium]|nr:3-hydroxybutyryl-CoA dehydrogenase [Chloroflexota bacterium]